MAIVRSNCLVGSLILLLAAVLSVGAVAGEEAFKDVPRISPTRVWTADEDTDWGEITGFGTHEGYVRMMSLMMVGGSGYEGMQMGPHTGHAAHPQPAPSEAPSHHHHE